MQEQEVKVTITVEVVGSETTEVSVDKVRIGEIVIPNVTIKKADGEV